MSTGACVRRKSFFGHKAVGHEICSLCHRPVSEHGDGRAPVLPADARIAAVLRKVADRVRAKSKSIRDYGWNPSATEESAARNEAEDAAKQIVRGALDDVADALEEEAEEMARGEAT